MQIIAFATYSAIKYATIACFILAQSPRLTLSLIAHTSFRN